MYCPKCGKENDKESLYCSACATPLKDLVSNKTENGESELKKRLFTPFLINFISLAFIVFSTLVLLYTESPAFCFPYCYFGIVVSVLGLAIYWVKYIPIIKALAFLHLLCSVFLTFAFLYTAVMLLEWTCILGFLLPIFSILQIIAGVKNTSAIKNIG